MRLEARRPNIEGKGEVPIRDLVSNALRMRPDRIIVGEVRGGEALDMLQAMNTGHDGSHDHRPRQHARATRIARLETMVLMAGMDLPLRAIREQIASAMDLIVHQARMRDGSRKITNITEVQGMEGDVIVMQDVFVFEQTGIVEGKILGRLKADRHPAQVQPRSSRSWAFTCRPVSSASRTELTTMNPLVLIAAALAAVAVLLIVFALFGARGGDLSERLERYASAVRPTRQPTKQERQTIGQMLAGSATLTNFNKVVERRDWGADLARELARADLVLKPSEFLALRAAAIIAVPSLCFVIGSTAFETLANPIALVIGGVVGFSSAHLAEPSEGQAPQGVQQQSRRHDHPDLQCTAVGILVPAGHRAGRPRDAAADLHRIQPRHPRGEPRPPVRGGPRQHGSPRPLGRSRADDDGHFDPAPGRRQPCRDPRLHCLHHPGAGTHQGRDPYPHGAAADVRLRRRVPPDRARGILMVIAPKFMDPMFQKPPEVMGLPLGVIILGFGGLMMAIGFFFIRRIVNIEV